MSTRRDAIRKRVARDKKRADSDPSEAPRTVVEASLEEDDPVASTDDDSSAPTRASTGSSGLARVLARILSPGVSAILVSLGYLALFAAAWMAVEWYRATAEEEEAVRRAAHTEEILWVEAPPPGTKAEKPGEEASEEPSLLDETLDRVTAFSESLPIPGWLRTLGLPISLVFSVFVAMRRSLGSLVRGVATVLAVAIMGLGLLVLVRRLGASEAPTVHVAYRTAPTVEGMGGVVVLGGGEGTSSTSMSVGQAGSGTFTRFLSRHSPDSTASRCDPGLPPFTNTLCRVRETRAGGTTPPTPSQGPNSSLYLTAVAERLRACTAREQALPPETSLLPATPPSEDLLQYAALLIGPDLVLPGVPGSCAEEANAAWCTGTLLQLGCAQVYGAARQALERDPTWTPLPEWSLAWAGGLSARIGECWSQESGGMVADASARVLRYYRDDAATAITGLEGLDPTVNAVADNRLDASIFALKDMECPHLASIVGKEEAPAGPEGAYDTTEVVREVLGTTRERILGDEWERGTR